VATDDFLAIAEQGLDPELSGSCTGLGLKYHHLWGIAKRYVLRGDDYHRRAGMQLIADFSAQMPLDDAADLIEWHFERSGYHPSFGGKPSLDKNAFRAAVAVGLVNDYITHDTSVAKGRRGKMTAVVARALLVTTARDERPVVESALRALLDGNPNWLERTKDESSGLLPGWRVDEELAERCNDAIQEGRWDDAIRSAMIVLESRVRTSTGEALDVVGEKLVAKAFALDSQLNFGLTGAEKEGLLNLFRSAFLLFRNPAAHRFAGHGGTRALQILALVDLLLGLIIEGNTRRYRPEQYLALDEAGSDLRVERVLPIDLDSDGTNERVLVYSSNGQWGTRALHLLVLKEDGGAWRRAKLVGRLEQLGRLTALEPLTGITPPTPGQPMQSRVVIRIDRTQEQSALYVLEWRNGFVALVLFDADQYGSESEQDCIYSNKIWGMPEFRDADGDGKMELHVPAGREFYSLERHEVVQFSSVFGYDSANSRFHLLGRYPATGQMVSGEEARKFLDELEALRASGPPE